MKVSVCVASYNGQEYIREQLVSILRQLKEGDEVIVCDDGSHDGTLDVVRSLRDPRVALHTLAANVGHVKNFERAMRIAAGDVIFLSDQDDIWAPEKYEIVVDCFDKNPDVELVHHALSTIDSMGRTIAPLWNSLKEGRPGRLRYLLRQVIKCQVFGCALAFRRSLLPVILPFPRIVYAHDHWLAVAAGVCGAVLFLNEPLVRYRQHGANMTPQEGLGWTARVFVRLKLLCMIGIAAKRRVFPSAMPARRL